MVVCELLCDGVWLALLCCRVRVCVFVCFMCVLIRNYDVMLHGVVCVCVIVCCLNVFVCFGFG